MTPASACFAEAAIPRAFQPAALFRQAIELLRAGDPAAAALLPQLERFAGYVPGWLALGEFLLDAGKIDAAITAFGRARQDARAMHRIGQCLLRQGRPDAALAALHEAVRIDPALAEGWYSLASAHQDAGSLTPAIEAYRAALRAKADFHEAAFNLAVALQEMGTLDAALDAYGAALRLRPDSLARIAQALTSGQQGMLWLDPDALRRELTARRENPCDNGRIP